MFSPLFTLWSILGNFGFMAAVSNEPSAWESVPIEDLADEADVVAALQATIEAEDRIEAHLESLFAKTAEAAAGRSEVLASIAKKTDSIDSDVIDVTNLLTDASRTADSISRRIRELDIMIRNAQEALFRVEDILSLKTCVEGLRDALEVKDYYNACFHAEKFLNLGDAAKATKFTDGSSLASIAQINQSIEELTVAIRQQVDSLIDSGSTHELLRSCQLFAPLGLKDEGLEKFATFLKTVLVNESEQEISALLVNDDTDIPLGSEEPHVVLLTKVYEIVAGLMDDCENELADTFGPLAVPLVTEKLQSQCDTQADKILRKYIEMRKLDAVESSIRSSTADARDIDPLLDEIAIIAQRTATYFSFMNQRAYAIEGKFNLASSDTLGFGTPVMPTSPTTPKSPALSSGQTPKIPNQAPKSPHRKSIPTETEVTLIPFLENSVLQTRVKELMTRYTSMEAFFIYQNVDRAISFDEPPEPESGQKISTVVDDVFFVLQKCARRAVSYRSVDTLCDVIDFVNKAISEKLLKYIRQRMNDSDKVGIRNNENQMNYLVDYALQVAATKENVSLSDLDEYCMSVNNAQVSSQYALRLRSEIERGVSEIFQGAKDRKRITQELAQISESSRTLGQVGEEGLDKLADFFTPSLRKKLKEFESISFVVDEASYSIEDKSEEFFHSLLSEIDRGILNSQVEEKLSETNWDGLVRRIAEWCANQVELILRPAGTREEGKKFNALGGLRLDRDTRLLSSFFAGKSRRGSVRDVFTRLSQISMLVNLESPMDIYDLWGSSSGGMTWRLTPSEVRRVLILRIDFSPEMIKNLKL